MCLLSKAKHTGTQVTIRRQNWAKGKIISMLQSENELIILDFWTNISKTF